MYWGVHTSLYRSLSAEAIESLERAIWFQMIGRVNDARKIFYHDLEPFTKVPVVTIELASFEQGTNRWGAAWRILDSALKDARQRQEDLDVPEYRLIALQRAVLGTRHRGDLGSSAREVERTQSWLGSVPVTEYTDVQASCIRQYVIAYLFMRIYSTYQDPDAELIPATGDDQGPPTKEPWGGLHQLRRSLCKRGMFQEANSVFRVEFNRTPLEERESVVKEFALATADVASKPLASYIDATIRIQWVNTCVMLQDLSRAAEEITKAEVTFNKFCDSFELGNRGRIPYMLGLEYEKLSCIQDPIAKLHRTEELAGILEQNEHNKTDMCLSDAADLAIAYYRATSAQEFQDKYFDLQSRLERYDETVSEDIANLVLHCNNRHSSTLASLVDRQKSLEWIDGFFLRYPHFSLPVVLALLYRNQSSLLRALRRTEEADVADEKGKQLEGSGPSLGKWLHFRQPLTAVPFGGSSGLPEYKSEEEDSGEPFFWPWRNVAGDRAKTNELLIDLLWEWSLDDVATGHISVEDFKTMMNVPEAKIPNEFRPERATDIQNLRSRNTTDAYATIFVTDSRLDALHEERYNRICKWLSEAPKGEGNRRIFCLVTMRDARQSHFADKKIWDLRIRELHQLLDLEPRLPKLIRESCPLNKGIWLGAMALSYFAPLDIEGVSDLTGAQTLERIMTAEKYNELAIDEYRRTKFLSLLAIHQRTGAQFCMMKILRLQQISRQAAMTTAEVLTDRSSSPPDAAIPPSPTDAEVADEIGRLRAFGVEKVQETDEIFAQGEIHASWSEGLDGITHRQDIAAFHRSGHTAILAINLLLSDPGEPSQDTISNVWGWVQKYKARSLARAIGVRSDDPPDLTTRIMKSPDAQPFYEKMLGLQRQIQEAEPMERFELRRQLDTHMRVMKQSHDLLRQLIDLREATPFEVSDITTIQAQAGTSVVLVDWFYVPPHTRDEVGRMLLFTARANSEPTMDIVTTRIEDIEFWQKEYLFPSQWKRCQEENLYLPEARMRFDELLGGLVAPLAHRTDPEEVLVLCPSNILHRVPLHALSVKADPSDPDDDVLIGLIHRNPVVYTHSHSLLRSCFAATATVRYSPVPMEPRFLFGIPEDKVAYTNEESGQQFNFTRGRDSIRNLARRFETAPMMDGTASKEQLLSAATHSRLLHLHTHCNWKSGDPLEHHIELPLKNSSVDGGQARLEGIDRLTAKELFDVRVPPSTHINMIACQGGVTDVKLGDEVMGLVPALLYSGVSSTVSTLWSIRDSDGARFTEYFFDSFLQQCAGQSTMNYDQPRIDGEVLKPSQRNTVGFINLARAVRVAAMRMDEDENQPLYQWAAFVLHGFWQFPLSTKDMHCLKSQHC